MGRGRIKRQAVQSDDGWTVITHGLSGLSLGQSRNKDEGKSNDEKMEISKKKQGADSMPDVVNGLTPEALLVDFKARQERWADSECARHVCGLLNKLESRVEEAVCIGIGSFSRDWEHRHRSLWQLVLFVDVVKQLRKQHPDVKMYAQEPAFTSVDAGFLEALDVEVQESGVEMHIGVHAFVFSPFVDWFLLLPVFLQDKDPELYVGNEILDDYTAYAQTGDRRTKVEECNRLGKTFLEHRDMVKLEDFSLHSHALNGMVAYWKKDLEEKGVNSDDAPA